MTCGYRVDCEKEISVYFKDNRNKNTNFDLKKSSTGQMFSTLVLNTENGG